MHLNDLEKWFENAELPQTIRLNNHSIITNTRSFISAHISYLRHNTGKRVFKPYYDRLLELYKILNNK